MHHVLSTCKVALQQGRYTYRHDLVLQVLFDAIKSLIDTMSPDDVRPVVPLHKQVCFVRAGEKPAKPPPKAVPLLFQASDWSLIMDVNGTWVGSASKIPSHIVAHTDQRPDILLWSDSLRVVILLELTVPAEVNAVTAHSRKRNRYADLQSEIQTTTNSDGVGWKVFVFPFEVTVRGFVGASVNNLLRSLGLPMRKRLKNALSKMALRGSYVLWIYRDRPEWAVGKRS